MIPLPQRLALQAALIFCTLSATLGLAAELGGATIIMRSVICALVGAAIGAGLGGLILWMRRIAADIPELPPDAAPLGLGGGGAEALPEAAAEALPAGVAAEAEPVLSEGQSGG